MTRFLDLLTSTTSNESPHPSTNQPPNHPTAQPSNQPTDYPTNRPIPNRLIFR
ncbi:MAG: PT domain-containing protein [Desulfatitalea sp.]|nr:PT domain-containing protein [Desulfatitalea sp.]